ncbi:MAG: long-chain fatty acid--CoA ligase [Actinobacteria bacterium]|nr:long-chain fatty acid--CoA ligase [Actinomycetota bacterium]MBU1944212.1 long-chain fatty acid--CoA ligase [Actinomycetota bacterium]MBU2688395.1 long-chain fatty acid--CoA ligase [Actinomycetota bacterium]
MNIGQWVTKRAMLHPDSTALISDDGRAYTYAELNAGVNRIANSLPGIGAGRGDRIATLFPNNPEFLMSWFAAAKTGTIMVPLNYRLTPPELVYILDDCGAVALAYTPEFAEQVNGIRGKVDSIKNFVCVGGPGEEGDIDYDERIKSSRDSEPFVDGEPTFDDVHFIMYTSGTTGNPKGATLTHGNTHWNAVNAVLAYDLSRDETNLAATPMYHIAGLSAGPTPTLYAGGRVILMRFFDPTEALRMIEAHRVTTMFGIPTMFRMMSECEAFDQTDFSSLRFLIAGGAPCPVSLIEKYLARGVTFNQGYGLTEAAPGVTALPEEDSLRKRGSAGKPLFYVDVDIIDDDEMEVPQGEMGEIIIKGPNVFRGYWNRPEETEKVLRHGWLHTGDVGYLDSDGYLYIADRKLDMIISGGENVYSAEVEKTICTHPKVVEVAVIGLADEKWGEVPLALVIVEPGETVTEEEIVEFCRDKLARFKTPKKVIVTEELPMNSTGKVLKTELRSSFAED